MRLAGITRNIFLLLIVITVAGLNWYCSTAKKNEPRTTYAGLSDTARYVGITVCKGCHPDVHATFIHTGMGQSFDIAGKQKSAAVFHADSKVYDKYRDFYYHPFWENDSLKFKEYRIEGRDTVYSRVQTISYIVGSGQHTNSHIWSSNGYLYQAPMTFYTQKKQWDLPPGFENGNNTRFSRVIGLECMSCHNGYPEFVEGSENRYNLVKQGIDCERCHGPGSIHAAEKTAGILVDTSRYIDYSIVNPSKLSVDLQFDVCQRCHIQGNAVLNPGKSFFDFKPGMKLSDVMNVFMPVYAGNEQEHIMASHVERLKMSPCYVQTMGRAEANPSPGLRPYKNALTCVTCHNPHVSVRETATEHFNTVCSNCHQAGKDHLCKAPESLRMTKNNNCVSCHMPFNGATDIPHVSVHDHRIAVHKEADPSAVKKFIGINCINNLKPPRYAVAQAFINYTEKFNLGMELLDSALKYIPADNANDIQQNFDQLVQVYFLKSNWKKVIELTKQVKDPFGIVNQKTYDNRNAWTAYRIAQSFEETGNAPDALSWYKRANQLAPLNVQFANKYGSSLTSNGKANEAYQLFNALIKEHPEFAAGWSNFGYLTLLINRDVTSAMIYYNKALALDPDYEQAIINKAGLLTYTGKSAEAITFLEKQMKHSRDPRVFRDLINRIRKGV